MTSMIEMLKYSGKAFCLLGVVFTMIVVQANAQDDKAAKRAAKEAKDAAKLAKEWDKACSKPSNLTSIDIAIPGFFPALAGGVKFAIQPKVAELLSKEGVDRQYRSYLRCVATKRDKYTPLQAAYLETLADMANAFIPSQPDKYKSWVDSNPFPGPQDVGVSLPNSPYAVFFKSKIPLQPKSTTQFEVTSTQKIEGVGAVCTTAQSSCSFLIKVADGESKKWIITVVTTYEKEAEVQINAIALRSTKEFSPTINVINQ